MKQAEDNRTIDMLGQVKRGRGRPSTGKGKTAAERQAERRARLKDLGLVPMTVNIPVDLHNKLRSFMEFKETTQDQVVERFLRNALRKR